MKCDNIIIGRKGEELACEYLCKEGYAIVEVNYRSRYAEIDLVAKDGDVLVFIEVKTCSDTGTIDPEELLNKQKLSKLIRNANAYAAINKYTCPLRIDAVCIVLSQDGRAKRLNHYKNIAA